MTVCLFLQTITGAMSTTNPPIELTNKDNQFMIDYIQEVASQPDFDYPPVFLLHLDDFLLKIDLHIIILY